MNDGNIAVSTVILSVCECHREGWGNKMVYSSQRMGTEEGKSKGGG